MAGLSATPRSPGPGIWRDPAFLRLFAGHVVSQFGTAITIVALMEKYQSLRGSTEGWGYFVALQAAPFALLGLISGAIADRFDRRIVVASSDLVRCAVLIAMARTHELPVLYALAFAAASGQAFYAPAYRALMTELVDPGQYLSANAVEETGRSVLSVLGIAVCGALLSVISASDCLYIDAGSYLVSAISVASLPRPVRRPAPRAFRAQLLGGYRLARATPALHRALLLWIMLTLLVGYEAPMFFPLVVQRGWGGAAQAGFLWMFAAIGSCVTGLALVRRTESVLAGPRALPALLVIDALALLAIATLRGYAAAAACTIVLGITETLLRTYYVSQVQRAVAADQAGQMFAAIGVVIEPTSVLARLASGLVLSAVAASWGLGSAVVVEVAAALALLRAASRAGSGAGSRRG